MIIYKVMFTGKYYFNENKFKLIKGDMFRA